MNGLGSNTCIQDAGNLAWKLNLVEKGRIELTKCYCNCRILADSDTLGLAGKPLLETYSIERQPVGLDVVSRY